MSFMYNPFPYDDPKPVNRPELSEKTVESICSGAQAAAKEFVATIERQARTEGVVVALDGYTTADWTVFVNLMARELTILGIGWETVDANKATLKDGKEIDAIIDPLLIWDTKIDPTLLYGKSIREAIRDCLMRTGWRRSESLSRRRRLPARS